MIPIKETAEGIVFGIQVVPKSSKREISGCQGDFLKIKLTAPPAEGRANAECVRFLADVLAVKKDRVLIVSGHQSRKKTISVKGIKKEDLQNLIPEC